MATRPAMRFSRTQLTFRRSLAWLLWLALLLPVAQFTALRHTMAHAAQDAGAAGSDRKAAHASSHCDLCLTASAVAGGALWATTQSLPYPAARHALPSQAARSVWHSLTFAGYRSRAPPLAPR